MVEAELKNELTVEKWIRIGNSGGSPSSTSNP